MSDNPNPTPTPECLLYAGAYRLRAGVLVGEMSADTTTLPQYVWLPTPRNPFTSVKDVPDGYVLAVDVKWGDGRAKIWAQPGHVHRAQKAWSDGCMFRADGSYKSSPDKQYQSRLEKERALKSAAETDALNFGAPAEDDAYADYKPEGSTAAVLGGLGGLAGIIAALGLLGFVFIKAVNIMLPLADEVLRNAAR